MGSRGEVKKRRYIVPAVTALCAVALFLLARLMVMLAQNNPEGVYDSFVPYSRAVMSALSAVTGVLPFSLAEASLFLLVAALLFFLAWLVVRLVRRRGERLLILSRTAARFILLLSSVYFLFYALWGIGYYSQTMDRTMGLDVHDRAVSELTAAAEQILVEADALAAQVERDAEGNIAVDMQTIIAETSEAFRTYTGGTARAVKTVFSAEAMSNTGTTGMFFPFTGEANINPNNTASAVPFTVAHELSHQYGVNREDEANFTAFLVCTGAEKDYIRYSGYFSVLQYMLSAVFQHDAAEYTRISDSMSDTLRSDLQQYKKHWSTYQNEVKKVTGAVYDSYLKLNSQEDGKASYGRVVDLLLAYMEDEEN